MPFRSEAQRRLFYAMMRRGEIDEETVRRWEKETGNRKLPERVRREAIRRRLRRTSRGR